MSNDTDLQNRLRSFAIEYLNNENESDIDGHIKVRKMLTELASEKYPDISKNKLTNIALLNLFLMDFFIKHEQSVGNDINSAFAKIN